MHSDRPAASDTNFRTLSLSEAVVKALDEVGYSTAPQGNWATAEVRGGDRARLKNISDQMDKLFAM